MIAQLRRWLWLFAFGVMPFQTLLGLLVLSIRSEFVRVRGEAVAEVGAEFATSLSPTLYELDNRVDWRAYGMASQLHELEDFDIDDRRPELLASAVADSVPDELLEDDDWLEVLETEWEEVVNSHEEVDEILEEIDLEDSQRYEREQRKLEQELADDRREFEERVQRDIARAKEKEARAIERDRRREEERSERAIQKELARLEKWEAKVTQQFEEACIEERRQAQLEAQKVALKSIPDGDVEIVWEANADACKECQHKRGSLVKSRKGHHINCRCEPDARPSSGGSAFEALSPAQLRNQLAVMKPLPDSPWRRKQTKRIVERLKELGVWKETTNE